MEENKSGRFRKKKYNFSMVPNSIIRDGNISLRAKGLFALIQSYITLDNFTLYKSYLMKQCREGERAFNSAWNELKEKGYLKMYKLRDGGKTFFYEYELLDEPEKLSMMHSVGVQNVDLQNVGVEDECLQNVSPTTCSPTNGDTINNNLQNNNVLSNINQIISIEEVSKQIDLEYFDCGQKGQATEIALLILDVYNMPDNHIVRISCMDRKAKEVKERFRMLDHYHIIYVMESLQDAAETVRNKRNYLLTALYNAPTTLETSYKIEIYNS